MQITVDQTETAGRGPSGITASVDMTNIGELPGNKPTDNFKLKSKVDEQAKQDTKAVNEILDKELIGKPAPEPDEGEVPVTEEAEDDVDSLFGS